MRLAGPILALVVQLVWAGWASAQSTRYAKQFDPPEMESAEGAEAASPDARPLQRLADSLPADISSGLEFEGWLWLSYLKSDYDNESNYHDEVLSLAITKTFKQRATLSAQGNLIGADGNFRVELEQGYLSVLLSTDTNTIFTIGKFNANFGVEGRDFWERRTGTTSLLFGAQPQDLIGFMITQPIGETGVKIKPFMSADFMGGYNFDQSPSAGVVVQYQRSRTLDLAMTNWVGPGVILYDGRPMRYPYKGGAYGYDPTSVVENWQGPYFVAEQGGTLYFLELAATWRPTGDLTLSAEYVFGRTSTDNGPWGWAGYLFQGVFDVNDRFHIFGRWSYLDDTDWLITGFYHKCNELSAGFGFLVLKDLEIRAEYRHDFSDKNPDFDSVSVHLSYSF